MSNKMGILVAIVFGGIGLSNIIVYAPTAIPSIMKGNIPIAKICIGIVITEVNNSLTNLVILKVYHTFQLSIKHVGINKGRLNVSLKGE